MKRKTDILIIISIVFLITSSNGFGLYLENISSSSTSNIVAHTPVVTHIVAHTPVVAPANAPAHLLI